MDSITTIVIIFVLISIINAIIKAVGKSQQPEKAPVSNASIASFFERFDEKAVAGQSSPAEPIELLNENRYSADQGAEENTDIISGQSLALEEKQQAVNLSDLFSDQESFITAYIFHEILEPPLALRKKKEKSGYGC